MSKVKYSFNNHLYKCITVAVDQPLPIVNNSLMKFLPRCTTNTARLQHKQCKNVA